MSDAADLEQSHGDVFLDARGHGRAMRLSWHPEADVVVLSLWREQTCAGTFRMPHEDVGPFVDALIDGLRDAPGVHLPPRDEAVSARLSESSGADLGETQAMPAVQPRAAFADWAFGPADVDGRATAS